MNKLAIAFIGLALSAITASAQIPDSDIANMLKACTIQYGTVTPEPPAGLLYPIWETETMTDTNTTASGLTNVVFVSNKSNIGAGYESWRAFDNVNSCWASTTLPPWIMYDCGVGNSNVCLEVTFDGRASFNVKSFTLSNSMDGVTWVSILTNGGPNDSYSKIWHTTTVNYGRYFKFTYTAGWGDNYARIYELNFSSSDYSTPVMTSDIAPSPYVSGADSTNGHPAWQAFDKDIGKGWASTSGTNHWISMDFNSNVVINAFTIIGIDTVTSITNYSFESSDDASAWNAIDTGSLDIAYTLRQQVRTNNNVTAYRYYRLRDASLATKPTQAWEVTFKHYK